MFALVDGSNFFVSCERVFQPELLHKPVVVLSNNDGCIVARSNEAKQFGIKMGEPRFKCQRLLSLYDIQVRSSNFALYADISQRMIQLLRQFSPELEVYSIDECFLYFAHKNLDFDQIGNDIKQCITTHLGIPVGIGFGKTKTLAKMANKLAKSSATSICNIHDYDLDKVLATFPVEELWGIGRRFTKKLNKYQIYTAKQYVKAPAAFIRHHFHSPGEQIQLELMGKSVKKIETEKDKNKSIVSSRSFGEKVTAYHHIQAAVASNITRAVAKLRKQGLVAKHIRVYLIERIKGRRVSVSEAEVVLPYESSVTQLFIEEVFKVLPQCFEKGRCYAKSGVYLSGLIEKHALQLDLFSKEAQLKQDQLDKLMSACDGLNEKFGRSTVKWACTHSESAPWKMKQRFKSHKASTDWSQLITI